MRQSSRITKSSLDFEYEQPFHFTPRFFSWISFEKTKANTKTIADDQRSAVSGCKESTQMIVEQKKKQSVEVPRATVQVAMPHNKRGGNEVPNGDNIQKSGSFIMNIKLFANLVSSMSSIKKDKNENTGDDLHIDLFSAPPPPKPVQNALQQLYPQYSLSPSQLNTAQQTVAIRTQPFQVPFGNAPQPIAGQNANASKNILSLFGAPPH
ncbi:MAG: hypothetical protein EZS28_007402 [Streblomastix strix]|uniref:Uncharacterized protein n=1 Tax=Streblomastix strix TaxID=222440 RepID=A0A5J4WQN5_9EUKA|nr:MAG: hypothetical protein EZS28_007402 [Streblomastix strix]